MDTDQPTAALLIDLKQRGLLDERWSSGAASSAARSTSQGTLTEDELRPRPPPAELLHVARRRRHQGRASVYGETDDFSYNIAENPVHVNDLNATILHCLGIDHAKFTFKFQGLDQRLTGVEEQHVIKELLS